jgi:hypothetical protein
MSEYVEGYCSMGGEEDYEDDFYSEDFINEGG